MSPNILIMGASGDVGKEMVNRLAHSGVQVRAAIHDPLKLDSIFNYPVIQTVSFDFENYSSICSALQGISSLFLIAPASQHLSDYVNNTLKAAVNASVKHIGFLSLLGADDPAAPSLARWYYQAESLVKNSNIPFTILRSNCLMQHILKYLQADSAMIYLPAAAGSVSFVDARDVAAVGADIFLPGADHVGKTYNLTGSSAYSMYQIADLLSRVVGIHIGYVDSSMENAANALKGKIEDWRLGYLLEYLRYLFSGAGAVISSNIEQTAGIEPVSFVDFVRDYASKVRSMVTNQI